MTCVMCRKNPRKTHTQKNLEAWGCLFALPYSKVFLKVRVVKLGVEKGGCGFLDLGLDLPGSGSYGYDLLFRGVGRDC